MYVCIIVDEIHRIIVLVVHFSPSDFEASNASKANNHVNLALWRVDLAILLG